MKFETIEEMIEALNEGKKVRSVSWRKECYLIKEKNSNSVFDEYGENHQFSFKSLRLKWELFEEPKEKVRYYPALYTMKSNNRYYVSEILYKNAILAKNDENIINTFTRLITEIPELIEERDE